MKDWTGRNQHSIYSTLGASNHSDYERSERDYYATHPSAIKALIENVDISDIWENACGELHLVKPLRKAGYTVYATDIVERKERIDAEIDFLTSDKKWGGDILTNPPYKYAQEWVEKSMDVLENGRLLCMFLKLTFLEGMKKKKKCLSSFHHEKFSSIAKECLSRETEIKKCLIEVVPPVTLGLYGRKDLMVIQ
jgi:hypothetical protein